MRMKKARIEISQSEAQEIARMLMNYGLVLDVISCARNVPPGIADYVQQRRVTDFQKVNARVHRLMIKWGMAVTSDKDKKNDTGK